MIEANKLIFPFPQRDKSTLNYLLPIKNNIIFVPKTSQSPPGCLCDAIAHHHKNPSSVATTSRSHQNDVPIKTIKIQPSRQFKMKMMQPKHKRSSTRLINLVASQININLDKNYISHRTPRDLVRNHFQEEVNSIPMEKYLTKSKARFGSDDLFDEDESEEFGKELKIQTVRVAHMKFKSIGHSHMCAKLWKYQNKDELNIETAIPCFYYQDFKHANKLLVYFHGNGEDIIGCSTFLKSLSNSLAISVLAIEYPGYSLYEGNPNAQQLQQDSIEVMNFLINKIGFQSKNILVLGRSIGSGPAVLVSSHFQIGGLILLSPFLSLRQVVGDLYGQIAYNLLKERFNNKERAKNSVSPCLIVHGTRDRLISEKHSIELSQYFQSYCMTRLVENMSHSMFNHDDFFGFVRQFQRAIQFH